MLSYCLKCRKNTESKNPKVARTKNGRIMFLRKRAVCDGKKFKFIKEKEASELLTLIRLGFLRVLFFWGEEGQFDPHPPLHISRRTYLISI